MCSYRRAAIAVCAFALLASAGVRGQTRILPLGDSITHGGQGYVSYRYPLWFGLRSRGYNIDFVGARDTLYSDSTPIGRLYPDYATSFDRDHQGTWGIRTDALSPLVADIAVSAAPDVVLVHLGTNDIGQSGSAGIGTADRNLRLIIERLRAANPSVTVLLARVTPIGEGTSYASNAAQVGPLNAAIDAIAAELDAAAARVRIVDLNTGFNLATMMQADGLHPNEVGERWMASRWEAALAPFLEAGGNRPPTVRIDSPANGAVFGPLDEIAIRASANDADGAIRSLRFLSGDTLLGTDDSAPFEFRWVGPSPGIHVLSAQAIDDQGATARSQDLRLTVLRSTGPGTIEVGNQGFEAPLLPDAELAEGPGNLPGWTFSATAQTFVGIFNPPAGSYPGAAGSGTPAGAEGRNVAYLFNNGGPAQSVAATQILESVVRADSGYELTVAIGKFLPDQPYAQSSYGGYRIELLAGNVVIAADQDSVTPAVGEFRDAVAYAPASGIGSARLGARLGIRLTLSATAAARSTHFDDVRIRRIAVETPNAPPATVIPWLDFVLEE